MSAYGTVTRSAPAGRRPPKPSLQIHLFMKTPVDASYRAGGWLVEPVRPCAPSARRRRLMLEIGCGTGSAGLAFLLDNEDDPNAVVVFVDIYPPAVAFRVLNTYGLRPFPRAGLLPPCDGDHMVDSAGHRTTGHACMGCGPL